MPNETLLESSQGMPHYLSKCVLQNLDPALWDVRTTIWFNSMKWEKKSKNCFCVFDAFIPNSITDSKYEKFYL